MIVIGMVTVSVIGLRDLISIPDPIHFTTG